MFLIVLTTLVSSLKLVEYRLWQNFGQVIIDTSLNGLHAVNGVFSTADEYDCEYSDRGLYYNKDRTFLKMPKNDLNPNRGTFNLPYVFIAWIFDIRGYGRYIVRFMDTRYWILKKEQGNYLAIDYRNNNIYETIESNNYDPEKSWKMISVDVLGNSISVKVNQDIYLTQTFQYEFIEIIDILNSGVGNDCNHCLGSFNGFLWYMVVIQNEDSANYISLKTSDFCLSAKSCSCLPEFKLELIQGCISNFYDINLNSENQSCNYSKCVGGKLPECDCSSLSCTFDAKTECACLDYSRIKQEFKCICHENKECCNDRCISCSNLNKCISCLNPDLEIIQNNTCKCKSGYYLKASIDTIETCSPCNPGCNCNTSTLCSNCSDINAYVSSDLRCHCNEAYYPNILNYNESCLKCPENCSSCINSNICTACKTNFSLLENGACICKNQYYLNEYELCSKCHSDCLDCESEDKCLRCMDNNAVPASFGCRCKDGFWKNEKTEVCENCSNYCKICESKDVCLVCLRENSEPTNFCNCKSKYYRNSSDFCVQCEGKCENCEMNNEGKIRCLNCSIGYKLQGDECILICGSNKTLVNDQCECLKGFDSLNDTCIQSHFILNIWLDSSNLIYLNFSEELQDSLTKKMISITLFNKKLNFDLSEYSKSFYQITCILQQNIANNTSFELDLPTPLYSTTNKTLLLSSYTLSFYTNTVISPALKQLITQAQKSSKTSNSVSILLSLLTNPSSAWLLMNTIQLLKFLPLSQIPLTPAVEQYCQAIGEFNIIPNLPEFLSSSDNSSAPSNLNKKIGIKSKIIWINIGSELSLLFGLIILLPFLIILKRFHLKYLSKYVNLVLSKYKYSIFIRFWLQVHLLVGVFGFIGFDSVIGL